MILQIPKVLDATALAHFERVLVAAPWTDGKATAGYQSAIAKRNLQLPVDCAETRELGATVVAALGSSLMFQAAALPQRIFPPLFNRYEGGHDFGTHVDNAIRVVPETGERVRTDLSATLFLSGPDSYEGGELLIEDVYGAQSVKLQAGDMVLYPATSLHRVAPVTRGARVASFFWVQSLVREDSQRSILFDMDMAIQGLRGAVGDDHSALIALTGCYHNLLRRWATP